MWSKVDAYVDQYHILSEGDAVVIGLSGGADSIALAEYLLYRKKSLNLKLAAVHVNHQLRGQEAIRDEAYAKTFCKERGIPLTIFQKDVKAYARERHLTEEEAGREIRYACFAKVKEAMARNDMAEGTIVENTKAGTAVAEGDLAGEAIAKERKILIAVAHHMDDQAETLLFRMARGTGPMGMAGMRPKQGGLIRPLLCLRKCEILSILRELGTAYVTDSTNQLDLYHRNYIRRQILPALTEINTRAVSHMALLARQTSQMVDYLSPKMDALYQEVCQEREEGMVYLAGEDFIRLAPFEQSEVLRRMLLAVSGKRKDIEALHVDLLSGLFYKEEGKRLDLPYQMGACRVYGGVLLYKKDILSDSGRINDMILTEEDLLSGLTLKLAVMREGILYEGCYTFSLIEKREMEAGNHVNRPIGKNEKKDCIACFDYDRIKSAPHIRRRQEGDYFVMDRTGMHKALRRYFIDRKVPARMRDEILLLADGSHIMWVPGMRVSEEYKICEQTKRMLLVRTEPEGQGRKEEYHG